MVRKKPAAEQQPADAEKPKRAYRRRGVALPAEAAKPVTTLKVPGGKLVVLFVAD